MLVYSLGGGRIYHTESCPYAKRIQKERRGYFYMAEEAEAAGYHACAYCSFLGNAFRRARKEIISFCKKAKLTCTFREGRIVIETPVDRWLLVCSPVTGHVLTYHENHGCHGQVGPVPGYHNQRWAFHSFPRTLERIYHHTMAYLKRPTVPMHVKGGVCRAYKMALPKGTSARRRAKQNRFLKAAEKRRGVDRVLALIDSLDSLATTDT